MTGIPNGFRFSINRSTTPSTAPCHLRRQSLPRLGQNDLNPPQFDVPRQFAHHYRHFQQLAHAETVR